MRPADVQQHVCANVAGFQEQGGSYYQQLTLLSVTHDRIVETPLPRDGDGAEDACGKHATWVPAVLPLAIPAVVYLMLPLCARQVCVNIRIIGLSFKILVCSELANEDQFRSYFND